MFFVYILACLETGRTYVGQTDHLLRRYRMHCEGLTLSLLPIWRCRRATQWGSFPPRLPSIHSQRYFKHGPRRPMKLAPPACALRLSAY